MLVFYDNPSPPAGVFNGLLAIPSLTKKFSLVHFYSLAVFVFECDLWDAVTVLDNSCGGTELFHRGIFNTISVTSFSLPLLKSVVDETVVSALYYFQGRFSDHPL